MSGDKNDLWHVTCDVLPAYGDTLCVNRTLADAMTTVCAQHRDDCNEKWLEAKARCRALLVADAKRISPLRHVLCNNILCRVWTLLAAFEQHFINFFDRLLQRRSLRK